MKTTKQRYTDLHWVRKNGDPPPGLDNTCDSSCRDGPPMPDGCSCETTGDILVTALVRCAGTPLGTAEYSGHWNGTSYELTFLSGSGITVNSVVYPYPAAPVVNVSSEFIAKADVDVVNDIFVTTCIAGGGIETGGTVVCDPVIVETSVDFCP